MILCGASRLVLIGFIIGTAVSSITRSDLAGWGAGAAGVGVYLVRQRLRGTGGSCAIPEGRGDPDSIGTQSDPARLGARLHLRRVDRP
jgi:hypothetical protein